jgi:hypothetical protein
VTENQLRYSMLYAQLSQLRADRLDTEGNDHADGVRRALHQAWDVLTSKERKAFFAPGLQDREQGGPVNPDFRRGAGTKGEWVPFRLRAWK